MTKYLFTPGPVQIHPDVLNASALPLMHHRSDEFKELSATVWKNLQRVFCTESVVLILPGSGMTGIEAAMVCTLNSSDTIIVINHGRFSERLVVIAKLNGATVVEVTVPWGEYVDLEQLESVLKSHSNCKALWMVHGETSTGVVQPLRKISELVRSIHPNILLCVDAVLTVGVEQMMFDEWKIDIAVTATQKGLQCVPGAACVALSPRAIELIQSMSNATYCMDLITFLTEYAIGSFPYTPPVTLMRSLDVSLQLILANGLQATIDLQAQRAARIKQTLLGLGYTLFGLSNSNSVMLVEHSEAKQLAEHLKTNFGISVSGGQQHLRGKLIRIGIMGDITADAEQQLIAGMTSFVSEPTATEFTASTSNA
ncbi:MAG: alanine--glyoxylate aminotransferase family protein [Ignavibacteria bacterium]|nr:alanine--glyoxylate aminotransferase family protein [Ignavibacteria bacterium]